MSELARHTMYGGPALLLGLALLFGAHRARRWWPWTLPAWGLGAGLLTFSAIVFGPMLRPMPAPNTRALFEGVRYERRILRSPVRVVVHVVQVDLQAPGLEVFMSPGDSDGTYQAKANTTSGFLEASGAQLAVNASYFYPWHSNTLLDYYPHVGDPTTAVGLTIADGEVYRPAQAPPEKSGAVPIWWFEDGHAEIGLEPRDAPQAVSGFILLKDGRTPPGDPATQPSRRHPRVAVGIDAPGTTMWIVVADGRQPLYSLGLTRPEIATILQELGAKDALLLDGGGSAALAYEGSGGAELLNTPVHGRIPTGLERPVVNNIGIRARALTGE